MSDINDYLNLITSEHRDKPKFIETVSIGGNVLVQIQNVVASFVAGFDIDLAVGSQLDVIGLWVGLSREVTTPIVGIYFEWDGNANVGWEYGIWQAEFAPSSGLTAMPDDVYRQMLKGKIAANHWDGTVENAYEVWDIAFPNTPIVIQDNQDMSMTIGVSGPPLDSLTKALISQGYIPIKPEGVLVNYTFTTVDAPLFGWDIDSDYVAGWEEGAWGEYL